ncbi:collagen alpha-5(VI) chain, partial [Streptomyces sp. RSD-27]
PRLTEALDANTATSYRLTVPGAAHLAFMDGPLYLPPVPTIVGSLGRTRGPRVVAGATLAFLDAVLRDGWDGRGGAGDPADALRTYGELGAHRPGGGR